MAIMKKSDSPLDRFPKAPSAYTPRIVASSWGDIGSGKTRFVCTAPAPVVIFSFDDGTEGVVEEFRQNEDKDIRVVKFDWAPSDEESFSQEETIELRNKFIEDHIYACQHARTVVWDRESDVWSMFRYAEFGAPKADVPRDFDKVNALMRKYVSWAKKLTINFIAIQGIREEWVSQNKKSGNLKRAGFGETPSLMNVDLYHERSDGKFSTTVGKARGPGSRSVQDRSFDNLDFTTLGMMLFPDTDEDDWR